MPRSSLVAFGLLVGILALQALRPGRERAGPSVPDQARPAAGAPASAELLFGRRLDLNRADAHDLEALPGIGSARAEAIVRLRRERGRFRRLEELLEVPGVGDKTLELLRPHVLPLDE